MFSLFALASAVLYGAADFIGGLSSRRADTVVIVVWSQMAGMMLVAALLPILGTPLPLPHDWMWGGIAGLAGGVGVALLYRALAIGVMSLVAPVTAVCAVAVPVLAAITVLGERPAVHASAGIAMAVLAIVLVSHTDGDAVGPDKSGEAHRATNARRGLGLALGSGMAIGVFLLALARTSAAAGLWPLLFARVTSVVFFGVLMVALRRPLQLPGQVMSLALAGGVLDMLANLLYLLATRRGPLTLVVTLSALYPASTVLLARILLHERLSPRQWAGVALAMAAIVMIVVA